jgi:tRNA threonylcarbamoyladenosine biosynthesis protein TsaB
MISLFIDTSTSNVSISIVRDGILMSNVSGDIPNEHSKYATSYVKKVIDDAGIDANNIDKIFVVNGPGSFTGVRIGVTIAKTYGYLINKYITPVSSLKALAISSKHDGTIMSVISANRNNYYVGIYDREYNDLILEQFINAEGLIKLMEEYNPYIVSNDFNVLGIYKFNKVNLDSVRIINYYMDKEEINYHKLVPNYLKLPQALENK